jgi:hypothetical protein
VHFNVAMQLHFVAMGRLSGSSGSGQQPSQLISSNTGLSTAHAQGEPTAQDDFVAARQVQRCRPMLSPDCEMPLIDRRRSSNQQPRDKASAFC